MNDLGHYPQAGGIILMTSTYGDGEAPSSANRFLERLDGATPLPVAIRPPTDFLWQRPPTTLEQPQQPATHREPGIDYLTPYWMLRYYTEVEHPAQGPLPTWVGPPSY